MISFIHIVVFFLAGLLFLSVVATAICLSMLSITVLGMFVTRSILLVVQYKHYKKSKHWITLSKWAEIDAKIKLAQKTVIPKEDIKESDKQIKV
jgi:hypothetical protein